MAEKDFVFADGLLAEADGGGFGGGGGEGWRDGGGSARNRHRDRPQRASSARLAVKRAIWRRRRTRFRAKGRQILLTVVSESVRF